jgi:NADPH:quinone reductase-like Zn-dependent oxidoreductase
VLIRVLAASVNPLDTLIRQGYGDPVLHRLRGGRFPYVPGLDCCGEVVAVGAKVRRFQPGQRVWAAMRPDRPGTMAELVALPEQSVGRAPANLDPVAAAALPYVVLTAWQALVVKAGLGPDTAAGRKVLVHAGAGGIGHVAIQLLKCWGAHVATTCSGRNVEFVRGLGADEVINYQEQDFAAELHDYDVVLNTLIPPDLSLDESRHLGVLKTWGGARYVTLITPLLHFIEQDGVLLGAARSGALLAFARSREALRGRHYHWVFFQPDGDVLDEVAGLVEAGLLRPEVQAVYGLDQLAAAHLLVETGRVRGKVVIDMGLAPA